MASTTVSVEKLIHFYNSGVNVLIKGKHGVGKSAIILDAFNKLGLKLNVDFLYFSGATLDPWVDFVGVPKEKTDSTTGKTYLELVRPKAFTSDGIKAIFIDEYNRTHKKIRNAVMELIQFKSINGRTFPNLKVVWTAINPSDGSEDKFVYDVDDLDPAQIDRFQIHIDMPYKPDPKFFATKFGHETATAAISWWESLPAATKDKVSPRRLDYAIEAYNANIDLLDVLPEDSNVPKLKKSLQSTPAVTILKNMFDKKEAEKAKEWIEDENNYESTIKEILKDANYIAFFVPLMPDEKISKLVAKEQGVRQFALKHYREHKNIKDVLVDIKSAALDETIIKEIDRQFLRDNIQASSSLKTIPDVNPNKVASVGSNKTLKEYDSILKELEENFEKGLIETGMARSASLKKIKENVPSSNVLNLDVALRTLKLTQSFVERSQEGSIFRWFSQDVKLDDGEKNFIAFINNIVECMYNKKYDFTKFSTEFGRIYSFCAMKKGFFLGKD